jgi:hypothetical protein
MCYLTPKKCASCETLMDPTNPAPQKNLKIRFDLGYMWTHLWKFVLPPFPLQLMACHASDHFFQLNKLILCNGHATTLALVIGFT